MGFKRYRGPVETLEQANFANKYVCVICQRCRRARRFYAWTLICLGKNIEQTRLGSVVGGFRCNSCRRSVEVMIRLDETIW